MSRKTSGTNGFLLHVKYTVSYRILRSAALNFGVEFVQSRDQCAERREVLVAPPSERRWTAPKMSCCVVDWQTGGVGPTSQWRSRTHRTTTLAAGPLSHRSLHHHLLLYLEGRQNIGQGTTILHRRGSTCSSSGIYLHGNKRWFSDRLFSSYTSGVNLI